MDTDTVAGDQAENMFKREYQPQMPTFSKLLSGLLWFEVRMEVDEKGKTKTHRASSKR